MFCFWLNLLENGSNDDPRHIKKKTSKGSGISRHTWTSVSSLMEPMLACVFRQWIRQHEELIKWGTGGAKVKANQFKRRSGRQATFKRRNNYYHSPFRITNLSTHRTFPIAKLNAYPLLLITKHFWLWFSGKPRFRHTMSSPTHCTSLIAGYNPYPLRIISKYFRLRSVGGPHFHPTTSPLWPSQIAHCLLYHLPFASS